MHFIDETVVHVKAGDGGNGSTAMRREAHIPRGGPAGGDGGNGGSVVVIADPQLSTLLDYKYKRHYKAERGEDGRNKDQYGKGGEDLILRVPVGTVVHDAETGELLADLDTPDARCVVAQGGQGGRGNIHFKSPWNQAPRTAEPGTPVGKSTFISRVSRARPKIGDYPFTTLVPNLGMVRLSDERSMVIADIPGLIEGASEGAGLGHRFLRHVERTGVLLHLLEANELAGPDREPMRDFDTLNRELKLYAPELADKPQVVALNKIDLPEARDALDALRARFAERGIELHAVSAATGEGLPELLEILWARVHPR
jgi:GTP-binding protein